MPGDENTDPVHRALAEYVNELRGWDRAVRADTDDAVHQMRVTIRKLRSLLQAAAETIGAADGAAISGELRWLAGVLGAARDAEVLAERYQRALDRLPPELVRGRVRERLVDAARARYREGHRDSLAAMDSERYLRLLDRLDAVAAAPADALVAPASSGDAIPTAVDAAYRKVRKAARAAARAGAGPDRDHALHRLRKSAKRLRYTAVAAAAAPAAERAKVIQTLLGDHQDSVVSRAHLIEQADAARTAGEDTFSYGLLYQQEDDLAQRCRAHLGESLGALDAVMGGPE